MQMISRRGSVSPQRRLSVISGGVWMLLGCVGSDTHADDLQKRQCFSPEEAVGHQWRSLEALGLCRSRYTCR